MANGLLFPDGLNSYTFDSLRKQMHEKPTTWHRNEFCWWTEQYDKCHRILLLI